MASEVDETPPAPPEEQPSPAPAPAEPQPATPEPAPEPQPAPEVTTAAAWRRTTTGRYRVTLPSGATVEARSVDGAELLMEGLLNLEQLQGVGGALNSPEKLRAQVDAARRCATRIVVAPPVALTNGASEMGAEVMPADSIPGLDAILLLTWALGFSRAGLVQAVLLTAD